MRRGATRIAVWASAFAVALDAWQAVAFANVVFYPFKGTGTDSPFDPYFLAGLLASLVIVIPFVAAGLAVLWSTRRHRLRAEAAAEVAASAASAGAGS